MQDTMDLLSTQEVADKLGVAIKTVRRYIRAGKLQAVRLGRDYRIPAVALTTLLHSAPARPTSGLPGRITAVVNQKGGVGKTTTTFNLGVGLRELGRRVLLVDLDPQAALSLSAGVPIAHLPASIYQALLDERVDPASLIVHTVSGVDVLPATIDLAAAEVELINVTLRELILKDVLSKVSSEYDHILIDCPPSLGLLTVNALAAAQQVIIPMQCEFLATRGLALLLRTLTKIRSRLNRDLTVAGILPTMYDRRTLHAAEVLAELRAAFPDQVYDIVIMDTVRLKESPAAGLSILEYDKTHDVAQAYRRLAQEVDAHA